MAKKPPTGSGTKKSPPSKQSVDPLAAELDKKIGPLIPSTQRQQVVQRITQMMQSEKFSGPIAHPRHLEAYDKIVPGSAERIIRMAEKAQDHNISMEQKIVGAEISDQRLGMVLGFSVLLILVGSAVWAGFADNNVLAGLLLSTAVVGSVAAFIKGRNGK